MKHAAINEFEANRARWASSIAELQPTIEDQQMKINQFEVVHDSRASYMTGLEFRIESRLGIISEFEANLAPPDSMITELQRRITDHENEIRRLAGVNDAVALDSMLTTSATPDIDPKERFDLDEAVTRVLEVELDANASVNWKRSVLRGTRTLLRLTQLQ
jgi:uncharacterized coiled-coil protein SlyX